MTRLLRVALLAMVLAVMPPPNLAEAMAEVDRQAQPAAPQEPRPAPQPQVGTQYRKLTPDEVAWILANKKAARLAAWKAKAERRFIDFVQLMWPILEPSRPFLRGWAMEAICDHLQAVTEGKIRKLLINIPPGFCKSLLVSVFWPAWEWGPRNLPHLRYVCASYSAALTERDNDRCRMLVGHHAYRYLWGDRVQLIKDATVKFTNQKRGFKYATSVGGVSTGERGDRVIVDDPHSVKEAESDTVRNDALRWFSEAMPTRHNNKKKAVTIVIMQRVHQEDVSGLILSQGLGYVHLCLPMEYEKDHAYAGDNAQVSPIGFKDPRTEEGELLFPELYDESSLEELKTELRSWGGTYAEAGQLQQYPVSRTGGMFNMERIDVVDYAPEGGFTVRAWDLAGSKKKTSPWTVAVKMRIVRGALYVLDVKRRRVSPTELDAMIKEVAQEDGPTVLQDFPQDPGQAGLAQIAHFATLLHGYWWTSSVEPGEKEVRARPYAAQVGGGNVHLVRGDWNAPYKAEMTIFPAGKFKDQIDASSRGYYALIKNKGEDVASEGGEVFVGAQASQGPSALQRLGTSLDTGDVYGGVY